MKLIFWPDCDHDLLDKIRTAMQAKGLTWTEIEDNRLCEKPICLDAFFGEYSEEEILSCLDRVAMDNGVIRFDGLTAEEIGEDMLRGIQSEAKTSFATDDPFCGEQESNDWLDK